MTNDLLNQILDIENNIDRTSNLELSIKLIEVQQQIVDSWNTISLEEGAELTNKIITLRKQLSNKNPKLLLDQL